MMVAARPTDALPSHRTRTVTTPRARRPGFWRLVIISASQGVGSLAHKRGSRVERGSGGKWRTTRDTSRFRRAVAWYHSERTPNCKSWRQIEGGRDRRTAEAGLAVRVGGRLVYVARERIA